MTRYTKINFLNMKYKYKISHFMFCFLFPTITLVIGNVNQINITARWFSSPEGRDILGLTTFFAIAFLINIAIFSICSERKIIKITALFFLILTAIPSYFTGKYQVAIDRSVLENIFRANSTDIKSFLSFSMISYSIFMIAIPAMLLKFIHIDFPHSRLKWARNVILIFLVTITTSIGLLYWQYNSISLAMNISNRIIVQTLAPINIIQSLGSMAQVSLKEFFIKHRDLSFQGTIKNKDNLVVVLAIGETARQKNFSLYGYKRKNTNPLLGKISNLHVLNAKARYGSTIYALPEILSKNGIPLAFVTQKLGINTSCYVNFTMYEACDSVGEIQVKNCPPNGDCYDGDVVPLLADNLKSYKSGYRLVLLHLGGGSHGPNYQLRYPVNFQKFTPICSDPDVIKNCTKEELYNSYDNTILYVDTVLNNIIQELDQSKIPYVFIYISDHGESLLEEGRVFHGMPIGIKLPPEQAEIPLIVKSSDLIQIKKRPEYLQNNIFDTVTSLFSIEGNIFDEKASFIQRNR